MKKFWLRNGLRLLTVAVSIALIAIFFPFLSTKFIWLAKMGVGLVIILGSSWSLLGLALKLGVEYWMFKRVAKKQNVTVRDIYFAVYELRWNFMRVSYDENFPRDYSDEIHRLMMKQSMEKK